MRIIHNIRRTQHDSSGNTKGASQRWMVHHQSRRLPHKPKAPNKARKSHSTKPQRGLETGNTKQHLQAGGAEIALLPAVIIERSVIYAEFNLSCSF